MLKSRSRLIIPGKSVLTVGSPPESINTPNFPCSRLIIVSTVCAGLLGGIIGAKLVRWIIDWQTFAHQPGAILDPQLGGRTIIGGIIFGWLAVELAKMLMGIKRSTGDSFALALPAGEAVGRIGCFLNGCCYGIAANVPWAVYQHEAWRHPTQLYSCAVAVSILAILLYLRHKMPHEGDLFRLYLILYGFSRFGLEFLRERTSIHWGLSTAQWICLEIVAAMIVAFIIMNYRDIAEKVRGIEIGS